MPSQHRPLQSSHVLNSTMNTLRSRFYCSVTSRCYVSRRRR